jgi:hypothetical protein
VPIDLAPLNELDAFLSSIFVFVGGVLGLGASLVFALARWRRFRDRAAAAERAVRGETAQLAPGFAVVSGAVETDDAAPAIEIVIRQRGEEFRQKQGWSVVWRETARQVEVRPFYLVRASGDAVRVEPDESVFLVDSLKLRERPSEETRVLAATLDPREECTVTGVLVRARDPRAAGAGYREAGETLVLVPPSGERMIVSVEPLPERYHRRARFHRRAASAIGVLFAVVHVALLGSYYASILFGRVAPATVVDTRTWSTSSKGSTTAHYAFVIAHPAASLEIVRVEVSGAAFTAELAASARGAHLVVPVRYVPGTAIVQAGEEPRLSLLPALLTLAASVATALVYAALARSTRAWYEQPKLSERVNGRLARP